MNWILLFKILCWVVVFWLTPVNIVNCVRGTRLPEANFGWLALAITALMYLYGIL